MDKQQKNQRPADRNPQTPQKDKGQQGQRPNPQQDRRRQDTDEQQ